jgi:hypothetical protein
MKKNASIQGSRAGSGCLGYFKTGQVGLDRLRQLGWSWRSRIVRNTKVIKKRVPPVCKPNICTNYDSLIPFSSVYEVFFFFESCMLQSIITSNRRLLLRIWISWPNIFHAAYVARRVHSTIQNGNFKHPVSRYFFVTFMGCIKFLQQGQLEIPLHWSRRNKTLLDDLFVATGHPVIPLHLVIQRLGRQAA